LSHGRGIFQYDWGFLPKREPIDIVIGDFKNQFSFLQISVTRILFPQCFTQLGIFGRGQMELINISILGVHKIRGGVGVEGRREASQNFTISNSFEKRPDTGGRVGS
jgi:hypothetical protein